MTTRPFFEWASPRNSGNLMRGSVSSLWSCQQHGPVMPVTIAGGGIGWLECPYCAKEVYAKQIQEAETRE